MKKLIIMALILAMLASNFNLVLAKSGRNEETDTRDNLIELGFTEEEINNFSDDEFDKFSKLKGIIVSKKTTYTRISPDGTSTELNKKEALKEAAEINKKNKETIEDNQVTTNETSTKRATNLLLEQTVTVSSLNNGQYFIKNSFKWLTNSLSRYTDVLAISHSTSLSNNSSNTGAVYLYDWKVSNGYPNAGTTGTKTNVISSIKKSSSTGFAWAIDLKLNNPDIKGTTATNHRGYAYMIVNKTPSNFTGYANAYGHYFHQKLKLSGTMSISINGASVNVTPTLYFTEANNNPNVQFYIR